MEQKTPPNETTSAVLKMIVSNVVKLPGVKVDRSRFLAESFANEVISVQAIIDDGPVSAGVPQTHIEKTAAKLIFSRTSQSSLASFATGLPGGIATAATIPADGRAVFRHGAAPDSGIVLSIRRVRFVGRRPD